MKGAEVGVELHSRLRRHVGRHDDVEAGARLDKVLLGLERHHDQVLVDHADGGDFVDRVEDALQELFWLPEVHGAAKIVVLGKLS